MTGNNQNIVETSGDLTIQSIESVQDALRDALRRYQSFTVKVDAEALVDISFIQLLEAARLSARQARQQINLSASNNASLADTLDRGGFLEGADPEFLQFWQSNMGAL